MVHYRGGQLKVVWNISNLLGSWDSRECMCESGGGVVAGKKIGTTDGTLFLPIFLGQNVRISFSCS